ncbi:MAG TPA: transcriptional repressor [Proteobacteria bacterium]|nr:transcriptional repressor [Pseudomonadota bacterium]
MSTGKSYSTGDATLPEKSMNDVEAVVRRFRDAGLKITPQRLSIFELVMKDRSHPSADDIYRKMLEKHPSISFTTVYKTLQTLRDFGQIIEIIIDPERAHYDPVVTDHYHTFCSKCREIKDFLPNPVTKAVPVGPDNGFMVQSVQVHMKGICGHCRD